MKKILLVLVLGTTLSGCGFLTSQIPILSPTTSAGLSSGLDALKGYLIQQNESPAIIAAVSAAQTGLAADTTGTTWGQLIRDLLSNIYTNANSTGNSLVWGGLTALEGILATIGA